MAGPLKLVIPVNFQRVTEKNKLIVVLHGYPEETLNTNGHGLM